MVAAVQSIWCRWKYPFYHQGNNGGQVVIEHLGGGGGGAGGAGNTDGYAHGDGVQVYCWTIN